MYSDSRMHIFPGHFNVSETGMCLSSRQRNSSDEDYHRLCVVRVSSLFHLSCYGHLFHWRLSTHLNFNLHLESILLLIMCSKILHCNEVMELLPMQEIACYMPGDMIKGSRSCPISQNYFSQKS